MESMEINKYPKISIQYCSKCKWQNRAVWYLQEILQTFDGQVNDISLQPVIDVPGTFIVTVQKSATTKPEIIYKRKSKKSNEPQTEQYYYDGFPDSKFLKMLIRNKISPGSNLGHIDKYDTYALVESPAAGTPSRETSTPTAKECEQCNYET